MNPESRSGPAVAFICDEAPLAEQCRLTVDRETDWDFAVYATLSDFRADSTRTHRLLILPSRNLYDVGDLHDVARIAYGPAEDLRPSFLLSSRDYLRTPFTPSEFVIRGESILLRDIVETSAGTILFYSDSMRCEGRTISLRYSEYEIMRLFARARGGVVSRSALQAVFGYPRPESRSIDMRVSRLRKKLRSVVSDSSGITIRSIRGVGYQLVD